MEKPQKTPGQAFKEIAEAMKELSEKFDQLKAEDVVAVSTLSREILRKKFARATRKPDDKV
jgi:hypothetical protein